jgi:tripartite-type tricarboxylate transporter receptor subunit TctC
MQQNIICKTGLKMYVRLSGISLPRWKISNCLCLAAFFYMGFSHAAFPEKSIHIVVPFVPGGAADSAVRLMAPSLQKRLGQPVLIENKGGAGATIGTAYVASTHPMDTHC